MLQAKSFDAPIKLLFPRALVEGSKTAPFSMLGLGDIVIPGIFVALVLRYDALHGSKYFRRLASSCVIVLHAEVVLNAVCSTFLHGSCVTLLMSKCRKIAMPWPTAKCMPG